VWGAGSTQLEPRGRAHGIPYPPPLIIINQSTATFDEALPHSSRNLPRLSNINPEGRASSEKLDETLSHLSHTLSRISIPKSARHPSRRLARKQVPPTSKHAKGGRGVFTIGIAEEESTSALQIQRAGRQQLPPDAGKAGKQASTPCAPFPLLL